MKRFVAVVFLGAASVLGGVGPANALPGDECIVQSQSGWVQCLGCGATMEVDEQYGHLQTCTNPRR